MTLAPARIAPLAFANLFPEFRAPSFDAWKERALGRITPDTREFYAICGRGAGKSRAFADEVLHRQA